MNPIYIHKGDSTIFADVNKFLSFSINTELDLTGWRAVFMLGSVTKEVTDISSKKFDIVLTQQETSKLWYGDCCACIKLIDANGNTKTVCNKIPFSITDQVVENNQKVVNLGIPNSCEIDIELNIGAPYDDAKTVKSVNGQTGNVIIEIPDIRNLATKDEVNEKQDKGDYALVSDIPTLVSELQNDSNFATQTQVMQAIASIPQFKLSIVSELPSVGEKMTLYLVAKEGSENDVYNEYIWIEQTSSFEFLGTTAVDLTDYVKNTDYATRTNFGLVRPANGLAISGTSGSLIIEKASRAQIDKKEDNYHPIVSSNLNYAVNSVLPTMTQAEYDALETKDENLFYMIVEE